jgi:hypothetical protein
VEGRTDYYYEHSRRPKGFLVSLLGCYSLYYDWFGSLAAILHGSPPPPSAATTTTAPAADFALVQSRQELTRRPANSVCCRRYVLASISLLLSPDQPLTGLEFASLGIGLAHRRLLLLSQTRRLPRQMLLRVKTSNQQTRHPRARWQGVPGTLAAEPFISRRETVWSGLVTRFLHSTGQTVPYLSILS